MESTKSNFIVCTVAVDVLFVFFARLCCAGQCIDAAGSEGQGRASLAVYRSFNSKEGTNKTNYLSFL